MNLPPKHILGIRIRANFTLPGLGVALRVAAEAHFFLRKFATIYVIIDYIPVHDKILHVLLPFCNLPNSPVYTAYGLYVLGLAR